VAVPLIVLTNGRKDCISRTIPSAIEHLTGVSHMVIVNDSPDPAYREWLESEFIGGPFDGKILHLTGEHGYWQAMKVVWWYAQYLMNFDGCDKILFLEDDFTFDAEVDLNQLATVFDDQPHLTQIALLRGPWFANEHEHGGLIEALEAQGQTFTECSDGTNSWIEHRACFTGNPSLIPRRTFEHPWPEGAWSESRFGKQLFADPAARGAYWGRRSDPPRVTHIGTERVGAEY